MSDYLQNAVVNRKKDRASPSSLNMMDKWRSWVLSRKKGVQCGRNVVFKKAIEIAVCDTGLLSIGDSSFIHAYVWFLLTKPRPIVHIGSSVYIGRYTVIAAKNSIEIGDYTIIAPRCYFVDHEHGFSNSDIILNQSSILKSIKIGQDCYFGTGTVVTGGVTIGDGAVIGANAVVTKDIPANQIWAGNPARYIRDRG